MLSNKKTKRAVGAFLLATLTSFCTPLGTLAATGTPQTFIISAYYSPCPDQSVYFRGSFEADKRLNGNGTHGADGTPVYPGMLAAPKSYAFGTQLEIPGLGVGAVHDRGGAIVDAGARSNAYDRIDVWMGTCEDGLARALAWGMRTVAATVYTPGSVAEHFDLPTNKAVLARLPAAQTATVASASTFNFKTDLQTSSSGADVERLQIELKTYGYFRAAISGQFDETTRQALIQFQIARRIVKNANEVAAGILDATTREVLNRELVARDTKQPPLKLQLSSNLLAATGSRGTADARFPTTLALGDSGDRVRDLQNSLVKIGANGCGTNYTFDDALKTCLTQFQIQNGVLTAATDFGAGVFGPKTRTALAAELTKWENEQTARVAAQLPAGTAQPGDRGETVMRLQNGLQKLGHFAGTVSGQYDAATREAVVKFQIAVGILGSANDFGAGFFGQKTRAIFVEKLKVALLAPTAPTTAPTVIAAQNPPTAPETDLHALPTSNPPPAAASTFSLTPQFAHDLAAGASGAEVATLQATLKKLGHFAGTPTGTFDAATAAAVLKFQTAANIVKTATDFGAGVLGPRTRAALNATVAREKIALKQAELAW